MEKSLVVGDQVIIIPLEGVDTFLPFKGEIIGFNSFMVSIKNLQTNEEFLVTEYQIKRCPKEQ